MIKVVLSIALCCNYKELYPRDMKTYNPGCKSCKNTLYVLLLILFCLCVSCESNSPDYEGGIKISVDVDEAVPLIGNIGDLEVVRLDVSTPAFPGEVTSASFGKDYFVLLDAFTAKGVYGYAYDGKQIFAYKQLGRGPKEVLGFNDVQIYGDSVFVFDNTMNRIIILDKAGEYVSKIEDCPVGSHFFAIDEEGDMYFDHVNNTLAEGGFNLTYIKANGSRKGIAPIREEVKDVTLASAHSLTNAGGKVSYMMPSTPIVLECSGEKTNVRYCFDFGRYWPDETVLQSGRHPYLILQDLKNGDWVRELRFVESEDLCCASFLVANSCYYFVYDKLVGKGKTFIMEDKDKFSHPLGFDTYGRLVLTTRSETPSIVYCTVQKF